MTLAGLLALGVAAVVWLRGDGDDPRDATLAALEDLAHHLEGWRAEHGRLPPELAALAGVETCYPGGACPRDAWGGMLEYRLVDPDAGTYRLRSRGPDRAPGTPDDLVWPPGTGWADGG